MDIQTYRREDRVSRRRLAGDAGISVISLYRYERGIRLAPLDIIDRLKKASGGKITEQGIFNAWKAAQPAE